MRILRILVFHFTDLIQVVQVITVIPVEPEKPRPEQRFDNQPEIQSI